ncbi:hypothetical protein [Streptomyces sp. WM6378]|uniref:hypothetical protein n=1 Tax=Streptomyces sp. WM6378 TaxID=1415557 RepID=UPI000A9AD643|nr:hypothetical protein [Streptomyces sp. WM6378]
MRDQRHRLSARLPGHRRGGGAIVSELFGHPLKDPFGDGEFIPLGPHFRQLLGQLFFEFVQFRAPRGDAVMRSSSSGSSFGLDEPKRTPGTRADRGGLGAGMGSAAPERPQEVSIAHINVSPPRTQRRAHSRQLNRARD